MATVRAPFIEPMLLQLTSKLPEGLQLYEVKLDDYRAIAFKVGGKVRLGSPNRQGLYRSLLPYRGGPVRLAR
jgi:ATP-dependent DNA ligase